MQQYRLNYPLLIGLTVGLVLSAGVVYLVWDYQIHRRSVALVEEADKAEAEGDYKSMAQFLAQYLSINPKDQKQQIRNAETNAAIAEQFDTAMEDRGRAVSIMESTLRAFQDEKPLRKRLAKFYGDNGMYKDAISHLDQILDDPEALVLRSNYLFRSQNFDEAIANANALIGYDAKQDKFAEPPKAAAPEIFFTLALVLHDKKNRPELAERVIDQALKANANSSDSYLARGRYFILTEEIQRGKSDVAKALEMKPDDAEALYVAQDAAIKDKEFDKARAFIDKGKKAHPKDARFYQAGAALQIQQKDYPGALKEIDEGLNTLPGNSRRNLLHARAELQLGSSDFKGVRETIQQMKLAAYPPEALDWYEAKALIGEGEWIRANALLNKLRAWAESRVQLAGELYFYLALSYEQLGKFELARRNYDAALEINPANEPAKLGKNRMDLRLRGAGAIADRSPLDDLIDETLKKPKEQQNWSSVDDMAKQIAEIKSYTELESKLLNGRILLRRSEFPAARKLASELLRSDPKNADVQSFVIQTVRLDPAPGQGPQGALQLLPKLPLEDLPQWRLVKAELLTASKDESTGPELAALLSGIDAWNEQQKVFLWNGMADRFLSVNMVDEARRCLRLVAEAQPGDLQSRMKLFGMALDLDDDESMKAAQKEILSVVGNSGDSNWQYTEARRRLSLIRRGREPAENLAEVRQHVARALAGRPDWHELYLVNAEIEIIARRPKLALEHLDRARKLGLVSPAAIAIQIRLLAEDGQIARAAEIVNELSEAARQPLLGSLYTDLLFLTGKVEEAVTAARTLAESNPNNAPLQYRYGELLAQSSKQLGIAEDKQKAKLEQAIVAVEKAVRIQPELPNAWYSLIVYNAMAKNMDGALKAMRDAQLSLSSDTLQATLAQSMEALGGWFDAEVIYRSIYEANPEDLNRVKSFANFYVAPTYRGPNRLDKAAPLINQILRAGADGKIQPNDERLLWARRAGAKLLADSGDYQQLLKAENMLASNSQDGILPLEDRLEMAKILSSRPEPESLIKAAGLLEEIEKAQRLGEDSMLMLADIYYRLGRWDNCKREMQLAAARFQKSAKVRQVFAGMLLEREKDLNIVAEYIKQLRELAPDDPATFEIIAKWAIRANQKDYVRNHLSARVAKFADAKSLSEADAKLLAQYAALYIQLNDLSRAEAVYRFLAKHDPKAKLDVANFLGMYGDVAQCFDMLEAQFDVDQVQNILPVAIAVERKRREEIGNKFDARIDTWLNRGLQKNFGSVPLLMAQAEFREIQEKYDEAVGIYRQLLGNPDVTGFTRAVLLNNLSYLVALADPTAASSVDALKLVQEAAQILGPTVDILDTRAVVYIARKQYDQAIADASLSVSFNPTAAKYFHKAQAHLGAKQNKAALEAWAKAEELGLSREALGQLEHDRYQQLKVTIEELRRGNTSVTRTEPAVK